MLSSAMVSVLAPHWSKRNQRTKKGISTEDFEAQNVPRGPHTGAQTVHSRFLEPHRHFREEIVLRDRPQLAGPIRKIEGWSSRSGPSSINLNSSTKRLTPFTASFDMGSHSLDNGDTEGCHSNPQEKTPPPIPSLSLVQCPNERMPPTGQGQVAQPSSKPITSSLLLSLRKIGMNMKSPAISETGGRSLAGSHRDRTAVPSSPGPSPTSPNNNSAERWTPRPHSSHIPYGPAKNNPNISRTTSVTNPLIPKTLPHPQKQIPTNQPGGLENTRKSISDSNTDLTRLTQFQQYTLLKRQALPRGTTLRSETWWKQVTHEGSPQFSSKDTANNNNNNRNETDAPLVTPCNSSSHLASLSPNDNRSLNRPIFSHAEYNKAEAIHRGTHDLVFKRQGGLDTLRQSNAENRAGKQSDTFPTHSNLNEKQSKWLHSSPSEVNVNQAAFKDNATKSPVTLLPTKSSANVVSQNVYSLDKSHFTANTQTALLTPSPISSPTNMDCRISEITSPKNQNQNQSIHTWKKPSYSLDVSDTQLVPHCTYSKPKPLAFERTYPSITTLVHPTTLSIYQSPVSSKTNCSPLLSLTSPTTSSTPPVSTTTPTSVHLTSPVTAATTTPTSPTPLFSSLFLLTPPVTPTPARSPSPKSSLSKRGRTFSGGLDISSSSKEQSPTSEGKSRRRVRWQDTEDVQQLEDDKSQSPVPPVTHQLHKTSPVSQSRSQHSLERPSVFSFLRESSPTEVRQSSPVCSPIPNTISMQVKSGERSKLTVPASPVSPMDWTSDHRGILSTSPGPHDNRRSDRANQWCSSTQLSLPADFGYQQRYSTPPYSTLKSARSSQGEAKKYLPTSPGLHQQTFSSSFFSRPSSLSSEPAANRTSPQSQHSPASIPPTQIVPLPFPNRSALPDNLKSDVFRLKEADNNSGKQSPHSNQNTSVPHVDSKALSLQPTLQDKTVSPSSVCLNVVETLVYSISKGNYTALPDITTPKTLIQCTSNTKVSVATKPSTQLSTKNSSVGSNQYCPLDQHANTSSTKEAQLLLLTATDNTIKNCQSPSWQNEITSTSSASSTAHQETHVVPDKATLESAHRGLNKMDHVLNKLIQKLNGRQSDDVTSSLTCNQSSKTPSISASSDSNISQVTIKSNNTSEGDREAERMEILGDENSKFERREMDKEDRWRQNIYTLIPARTLGSRRGDNFSSGSDIIPEVNTRKYSLSYQPFTEREETKMTNPQQMHQHFNESDWVDGKTSKAQCGNPNPCKQSPGDPHCSTTVCASSTNRPRSPFSPLSSTVPLSPFLTAPEIEDNVFYSPKELTPPGVSALEMGRSVSPLGTARRHMSTGPAIGGPSHACADLKYGIDAGRSISVSSVVSSRRLGSERISTGSRVLSMDDLLNGAHQSKYKCQSMGDQGYDTNYRLSSGPTEMRSRSLPRSLTRSLSCWSSEGSPPKKQSPTATPHDRLSGPSSRGTDHFHYLEGVLTPPPSPLSPAARQMSRPPRRSSPGSPGTPGDSESVRGMLSTRGLIASLSDFNESSSSDSESTTDDEYYLIPAEDDDKESAL